MIAETVEHAALRVHLAEIEAELAAQGDHADRDLIARQHQLAELLGIDSSQNQNQN